MTGYFWSVAVVVWDTVVVAFTSRGCKGALALAGILMYERKLGRQLPLVSLEEKEIHFNGLNEKAKVFLMT